MRDYSDGELLRRVAESTIPQVIIPGIVKGVLPDGTCQAMAAVVADDAAEDQLLFTWTGPLRMQGGGGMIVSTKPLAGEHCTIVFHSLDCSGWLAAPGGPTRAVIPGPGATCEIWPGPYVLSPMLPGGAWLGDQAGVLGVLVGLDGSVKVGGTAATQPAVLSAGLLTWIAAVISACAAAPGGPITIPPLGPEALSAVTKVL